MEAGVIQGTTSYVVSLWKDSNCLFLFSLFLFIFSIFFGGGEGGEWVTGGEGGRQLGTASKSKNKIYLVYLFSLFGWQTGRQLETIR